MINWIKSLWGGNKPKNLRKGQSEIIPAFEVGGVKYYQFDSVTNLPYLRGLAVVEIYTELDMKVDKDYLVKHTKAFDAILNENKLTVQSVVRLQQLNNQIKERLQWASDVDLAYKLASVVFFDDNEDPYKYDAGYNLKKIERWKKAEGMDAFFLREPLSSLIPYLKDLGMSVESYSGVQESIKKRHLGVIDSNISGVVPKSSSSK